MRSPYAPPLHPLPDNVWHTFLIASVSAFLVWIVGRDIAEVLMSLSAYSPTEVSLGEGLGHPLSVWIETISDEDPPWLWNRILGLGGWMLALGALSRLLMKGDGLVVALPTVLVLFLFPGLSVFMTCSGLLGLSVWCFLRAFRRVQLGENSGGWRRGGVWLGLAIGLHPVWILPALASFGGLFEVKRRAVLPMAVACCLSVAALFGIGLLAGGLYAGGSPAVSVPEGNWGLLAVRHVFLLGALGLLLGYGATRRGVGWWCLCGSLLLPVAMLLRGGIPPSAWVPLLLFTAMGLAKLPALLDIRHPRMYQSILLSQLLLWIPAGLDSSPELLFPGTGVQTENIDAP